MRTLNIGSPEFRRDAFETYRDLNAECPVHRVVAFNSDESGEQHVFFDRPVVMVTGQDAGSGAMLDPRLTVDALKVMTEEQIAQIPETQEECRPLSRSVLNLDSPDHTRLRKLVQKPFTTGEIERSRPRIREIADDLLDRAIAAAEDRGETGPNRRLELVSRFSYPLPMTVITEMLGVPEDDREDVRRWSEHLLSSNRPNPERAEVPRQNLRDFIEDLRALFAAKRAAPTGDLISALVQMEEDGDRLNEDELLSTVFVLIVAGHITTVNLNANAVYAPLTNPEQMATLRADRSLVRNAVEETLRYYGPAETTTPRWATDDMDIAGVRIERGELMLPVLAAANRDPGRVANPEAFDIERPNAGRHLAFGKGIHVCFGAPLARLEDQVALEAVLDRQPEMSLAVPVEEVGWQASFLRSFNELPLKF